MAHRPIEMIATATIALLLGCACSTASASQAGQTNASPIVALPSQPTALLEITVGTDGVGRDCKVLKSSGDAEGERLACKYFSRSGYDVQMGKDGRPVEYMKKVGVARSALLQLEQAH